MEKILQEGETPHDYRIKIEPQEFDLIQKQGKNMLEVCSGDGRNIVFFAKQGFNATGIESEDKYNEKAKMLATEKNAQVTIIKHPIFMEPLPFTDNSFDVVYSYQFLNHNFKDQIVKVFEEIYRIVKPGGLFSIKITDIEQFNLIHLDGEIYKEGDLEFPQIRYRKLADQTFAKLENDDEVWIPHYGFYQKELQETLEKIGFKTISIRKIRWNLVGNFTK